MNKKAVRTMAEMAELYEVSEKDFEDQLNAFKTLKELLEKAYFTGNHFYPKHQARVFQYLGEPVAKEEPIEKEEPKEIPPIIIEGGCFWCRSKLKRFIKKNRRNS